MRIDQIQRTSKASQQIIANATEYMALARECGNTNEANAFLQAIDKIMAGNTIVLNLLLNICDDQKRKLSKEETKIPAEIFAYYKESIEEKGEHLEFQL